MPWHPHIWLSIHQIPSQFVREGGPGQSPLTSSWAESALCPLPHVEGHSCMAQCCDLLPESRANEYAICTIGALGAEAFSPSLQGTAIALWAVAGVSGPRKCAYSLLVSELMCFRKTHTETYSQGPAPFRYTYSASVMGKEKKIFIFIFFIG